MTDSNSPDRASGNPIPLDGWLQVPSRPTDEMLEDGAQEYAMCQQRVQSARTCAQDIYRAMLLASPALPKGESEEAQTNAPDLDAAHFGATERAREYALSLISHPLANSDVSSVEYAGELLNEMVAYTDRLRSHLNASMARIAAMKRMVDEA